MRQLPRIRRIPQRVDELLTQASRGKLTARISLFGSVAMSSPTCSSTLPASANTWPFGTERGASRLLHLDGATGAYNDRLFRDLPGFVARGDVVVLNDTRVINARITGRKQTGGRVEVMVERVLGPDEVLAQVGVNHPPKPGSTLILADAIEATVIERRGELYRLRFEGCSDLVPIRIGQLINIEKHAGDAGQAKQLDRRIRCATVHHNRCRRQPLPGLDDGAADLARLDGAMPR